MLNKIKEALKQGYKNLGLDDSAFERVASLGKTFITEEAQIADFVKGAEPLLKQFQSDADKYRTLEGKYNALQKPEPNPQPQPAPAPTPAPTPAPEPAPQPQQPDIAALIQQAVSAAVKPLNDKLAQMEQQATAKTAFQTAKDGFFANGYVKQYADESNDAWERAIELNEATGSKMTAEELQNKAMGYFNKAVSRRGIDISKPFTGSAEGTDDKLDLSGMKARLQASGVMPVESQPTPQPAATLPTA